MLHNSPATLRKTAHHQAHVLTSAGERFPAPLSPLEQARDHLTRLLTRPEVRACAQGLDVIIGDTGGASFQVPRPGVVVISPEALASSAAAAILRHGLELAWLRTFPRTGPVACGVLAARVAALHDRAAAAAPYDALLRATAPPPAPVLETLWRDLAAHQPAAVPENFGRALDTLRAAWSLSVPAEHLMAAGVAADLDLCRPAPDARQVIELSSCTASAISAAGYDAAETCRRRLILESLAGETPREAARLRAGIVTAFGVADLAESVLAPSGTMAARMTTALLHGDAVPLSIILMGPTETGSGVPAAVREAEARSATLRCVPLRDGHGARRPLADIEDDIGRAVALGAAKGRVILHALDVSKTGLQMPRLMFLDQLCLQYGAALRIVIDASQARINQARLRRYLSRGHAVIVTGSKFFMGPPLSGALLLPKALLPETAVASPDAGLLLRWAAALTEIAAFNALPPSHVQDALQDFAARARKTLGTHPALKVFAAPAPSRLEGATWDSSQTIFTFAVRDPRAPARLLAEKDLTRLQAALAAAGCRLGKPVMLSETAHGSLWALRLAIGARTLTSPPASAVMTGAAFQTALEGMLVHLTRARAHLEDF